MADVSVRPARPEDAKDVGRVHVTTWRAAYEQMLPPGTLDALTPASAAESWAEAIERPPSSRHRLLVAVEQGPDGDELVGLSAFGPAVDPDLDPSTDVEVGSLLVHPDHGGHGHGSRLLAATVDQARADGFGHAVIWLFEADGGTQAFYESAGWAADGARRELQMQVAIPQVRLHTDITTGD